MVALEFVGLLLILTGAAAMLSQGAEVLAERYGANFTGSIVLALITRCRSTCSSSGPRSRGTTRWQSDRRWGLARGTGLSETC